MQIGIEFGQFIIKQRMLRNVTCQQLAKRIGISTAYLSQLERGIRINPDSQLLLKIAHVLNLSVEDSNTLFDLYAEVSGHLPPDITDYLIAKLSPITHKDKPLTESEAQLYRKIAISISGVLLSLVAFLLRIDRNIATIITLAMLVTASAMLVSVAMGRREKNER